MKNCLIVFKITMLLCLQLQAQELKRMGGIGVQFKSMNDSVAKANGLSEVRGLLVTKILGQTAEVLKIKEGDIVLKINNNIVGPVVSGKIYNDKLFTRVEGEPVEWLVWRDKKEIILKGKAAPKPKETSEEFEVIYDQFPFQKGAVRCVITKPKTTGKKPAILSIQGYPCSSIDKMPDWHPSKQIADDFTRRGYIVMRAEKPGVGDSHGTDMCYDIDFQTEVESFKAAYMKMKSLPDVDTNNLFIFGHSMGGMEAPFIASDVHPKGIIVYGVVTKSWYEYLLDMIRYQNPNLGIGHLQTEKEMQTYYKLFYELFVNRKKPSELINVDPEYKRLLERDLEYKSGEDFVSRHITFSHTLNDMKVTEAWSKVSCNVLSAYGEYDIQVVNDFGHREIIEIVNKYHPGKGTFVEFPHTDHLLLELKTQQEKWDIYNIPGMIPKLCTKYGINKKAMDAFDNWIKSTMKE